MPPEIEKKVEDFSRKFITDDGELCSVASDAQGTDVRKWLKQALISTYLAGEENMCAEVRKWAFNNGFTYNHGFANRKDTIAYNDKDEVGVNRDDLLKLLSQKEAEIKEQMK